MSIIPNLREMKVMIRHLFKSYLNLFVFDSKCYFFYKIEQWVAKCQRSKWALSVDNEV